MTRLKDGRRFIDRPIALIDIETTGSEPHQTGICLLGTPDEINRRCGEISEIACGLIDPKTFAMADDLYFKVQVINHHDRPDQIQSFDGYNSYNFADWQTAVPLAEAIERFAAMTNGAVPCSWGTSFERIFIEHAATQTGVTLRLDYHWTCIMSFALGLFRAGRIGSAAMEDSFSLETVAAYFNLPGEPKPHTALGGIQLEHQVFQQLLHLAQTT